MPLCAAPGCCNKSYRRSKEQINLEKIVEITFHKFPNDKEKKSVWIKNMNLCEETLPKSPYLCSLHFSFCDFDRSSLMRVRLKENAVPILTSEIRNIEETSCLINAKNLELRQNNVTDNQIKERTLDQPIMQAASDELVSNISELSVSNDFTLDLETIESTQISDSDEEVARKRPRLSPTSAQHLQETPRKKLLRKTLQNQKSFYQRQIRSLKQKNKRQEKRIAHLNTILKELKQKSLLAEKHADLLKIIDVVSSSSY